MTLMGIVQNFTGLWVARLFLGVAEAGLFPGVAVSPTFEPLYHTDKTSSTISQCGIVDMRSSFDKPCSSQLRLSQVLSAACWHSEFLRWTASEGLRAGDGSSSSKELQQSSLRRYLSSVSMISQRQPLS